MNREAIKELTQNVEPLTLSNSDMKNISSKANTKPNNNESIANYNLRKHALTSKVKGFIIDHIRRRVKLKVNFSDHVSENFGYNYTHVANMFSKIEGKSIQQFSIETKIDYAKELLLEGKTLTDISDMLNYSSVAHLSNQFKKVHGKNPTHFLENYTDPAQLNLHLQANGN